MIQPIVIHISAKLKTGKSIGLKYMKSITYLFLTLSIKFPIAPENISIRNAKYGIYLVESSSLNKFISKIISTTIVNT